MGWSGQRYDGEDRKKLCRDEFGPNYEILKDAMVGTTYYAAVKHLRPERNGQVFAAVTLTSVSKDEHWGREFRTKGMDEGCGPNQSECPVGILDLLSPLDDENDRNGYARAWRQRCRDYHAKKRAALKLEDGLRVSLPEPVSFAAYGEHQHFTVRKVQSRRKMRTVFVPEGQGWFASLRPQNKATLMTREDWDAQQVVAAAEAEATARGAVVDDYMDLAA